MQFVMQLLMQLSYYNQINRNVNLQLGYQLYSWLELYYQNYCCSVNKNALLDYKICMLPEFSFPVQIPAFYAKSWSLHPEVSMLISKWPGF